MAELFDKEGKKWIREKNGVEHEAGELAQQVAAKPTEIQMLIARMDSLEAKIDGIKSDTASIKEAREEIAVK